MISYFKNLFTDETAFVGAVRGILGAVAVFPPEALGDLPGPVRAAILFAALFVRSSTTK